MKIHIYHHIVQDDNCEVIKKLNEVIEKIDQLLMHDDDQVLKQQIMDKLNSAITDIKSTVEPK